MEKQENNEQQLSGKEAYEAKKEARMKAQDKQQRAHARSRSARKLFFIIVAVIVLGAAFYGLFIVAQQRGPQGEDFSQAVPVMESRAHIDPDAPLPEYTSNPPTSGPHYGSPARTGFRGDEDIADGHFIHTLEHGNVWISYQPDVSEAVVDALRDLAGNRVAVSTREENDTDVALAAWGRLDTFDVGEALTEGDLQRIRDFIARYTDKAPERLPPTAHSQGI